MQWEGEELPPLDISFEKEVGNLELPFYTRYGDKIVTLKGGLTLKFDKETRRLQLWMKSKGVPIVDKLPGATLFARPRIGNPEKESDGRNKPLTELVKVVAPGYITITKSGNKSPEKE